MNARLTEAELDAANAERFAPLPPYVDSDLSAWPLAGYANCSGDCNQGRRDCTCAAALVGRTDMWDDERSSPWLLAVYAATAVAAFVASVLWPWGLA